jgi:hypothetical protein
MVLVFPGALAAFAIAVGLTVGSPLALIVAVGTVMLLSAVFGMEFLGFLEMMLKRTDLTLRNAALYIIIPAAIAGAALGIFLGVTVLPVLTFGLSGPAALAVAGAIGLVASIILAAAALGGIRSYQTRTIKGASGPVDKRAEKEKKQEAGIEIGDKRYWVEDKPLVNSKDKDWIRYTCIKDYPKSENIGDPSFVKGDKRYVNLQTKKVVSDAPDKVTFPPAEWPRRGSVPALGMAPDVAKSKPQARARAYSSGDIGTALTTTEAYLRSGAGSDKKELESYHQHSASVISRPSKEEKARLQAQTHNDKAIGNDNWVRYTYSAGFIDNIEYQQGEVWFHNNKTGEYTQNQPSGVEFPAAYSFRS